MSKQCKINLLLFIIFLLSPFNTISAKHGDQLIVAGWLESIVLSPWQVKLRAKLDTGAKTSSIRATNVVRLEKNGNPWVRFELPQGKNSDAVRNIVETPVVREALIKRHTMEPSKRPVVILAFCINAHYYESEFTLAKRKNYNYPILLGRRFLQNNILVDSASTFMHSNKRLKQNCKKLTEIKSILHQ
jgi:hypothetical protein